MRFDLIIFDCDGVLVDSEAIANDVLASILGRHGVDLTSAQVQQLFIGQSVDDVRKTARRELDVQDEAGSPELDR